MATNHEILGRNEVDDLEAILAITNSDVDEVQHLVQSNGDAIFTWDYDRSRPALGKLYERAKKSQWNAQPDLPWDTDVDQEHVVLENALANNMTFGSELDTKGTPFEKWGDAEWLPFGGQSQNWDPLPVLPGRQGGAVGHGEGRRDRSVDRRQVLRGDAGDGRGPARRGVREVPRREAVRPLPDQRAPEAAPRRHHQGPAVGHDLPRHADHGRGPRSGRLRVHPAD